ncbi:MAG: hypothetical protein R3D03_11170 [Geminicoccaceae bacterium]
MSKVIRSLKPDRRPISMAPTTPVAGPDNTVLTGARAAVSKVMMPPAALGDVRRTLDAEPFDALLEATDMRLITGPSEAFTVTVEKPLVFAEFRSDLVAGRHEGLREHLLDDGPGPALMVGS